MIRPILFASLFLAAPASATIYVVDDNGGAGVHFTDLPQAVVASVAGDVLLVRPGNYSPFTLTRGISILADDGARVVNCPCNEYPRVSALPAAERAVVSGLDVIGMEVVNCAGPVLLERLEPVTSAGALIFATNSSDVRLRAISNLGVRARTSRVEVTSSILVGERGNDSDIGNGGQGFPAIDCADGAIVHASLCSITGGQGGAAGFLSTCPNGDGGPGGYGITVESGGTVLVTGSGSQTIQGGAGAPGASGGFCPDGATGAVGGAIHVSGGSMLHSNVQISGFVLGPITQVVPGDPALELTGTGVAGTVMQYRVFGPPGDEVRLRLGRQMVVQDLPATFEDRLTLPLRSYSLGVLPATGERAFSFAVPTNLPPGFVLIGQASTTAPSGETRLTQSAPIPIR